jgi:hypothetical protein
MAANVEFVANLAASDPQKHPVLIVGQTKHLSKLSFKDVRSKLEPRVTEDVCALTRNNLNNIYIIDSEPFRSSLLQLQAFIRRLLTHVLCT